MFGWKPKIVSHGAPIPLYYDYEEFPEPRHPLTNEAYPIIYYGPRPADTIELHKRYSETGGQCPTGYPFTFPQNQNVAFSELAKNFGDCPIKDRNKGVPGAGDRQFVGMNPQFQEKVCHSFDSDFECGNLDMVAMKSDQEYDLYMRVDANTRGHHQWFYFSVKNKTCDTVRFNIVNFTKRESLYTQGMRINVISQKRVTEMKEGEWIGPAASEYHFRNGHWRRSGTNIKYRESKIGRDFVRQNRRAKRYYCLSFDYTFEFKEDTTYFAYCIPYTYTMLVKNIRQKMQQHSHKAQNDRFIKEEVLCKSLSGVDVPLLTITSRVEKDNHMLMRREDYEGGSGLRYPPPWNDDTLYKPSEREIVLKKVMVITGRVHPGESNGSWMMQGFLNFITGNSLNAQELRRRVVFKVIPMSNVDGVIIGNYRSSLSGNDLNRQYQDPDPRLHPTVIAIKELISSLKKECYEKLPQNTQAQRRNYEELEPITCFIDMHGHSRKKSVFMYGPYFALHSQKYLKVRVIPKLMSERTEMFRYWACKFRVERSKRRAARLVLWKEFGITNCFTMEASFHGYINSERKTLEFSHSSNEFLGRELCEVLHQYLLILGEDDRQRRLREYHLRMLKKRKAEIKREMMERRLALSKKAKKHEAEINHSRAQHLLPSIPGAQSSTAEETDKPKSRDIENKKKGTLSGHIKLSERNSSPKNSRQQSSKVLREEEYKVEELKGQDTPRGLLDNLDAFSSSSSSEEEQKEEPREKFPALAASFSVMSQQQQQQPRNLLNKQKIILTSNSSESSLAINLGVVSEGGATLNRSQSVDAAQSGGEGTLEVEPSKFLVKAAKKLILKSSKENLQNKKKKKNPKKTEGKKKKKKTELSDAAALEEIESTQGGVGGGQRGLKDIFLAVKRGEKLKRDKLMKKRIKCFSPERQGGYEKDDEGDGSLRTSRQSSLERRGGGGDSLSSSDSSNSGGSDSDPEGDDLTAEELAELHGNMIQVIEKFSNMQNSNAAKKDKKSKKLNLKAEIKAATPLESKVAITPIPRKSEKNKKKTEDKKNQPNSKETSRRQTLNVGGFRVGAQNNEEEPGSGTGSRIFQPMSDQSEKNRNTVFYVLNQKPVDNMIIINQLGGMNAQEESDETERFQDPEEGINFMQHSGNQFRPRLNPKKARKSKYLGKLGMATPQLGKPTISLPPQQKNSASKLGDNISAQMAAAYHRSHMLAQTGQQLGNVSPPHQHFYNDDLDEMRSASRQYGISDMLAKLLEQKKFNRIQRQMQRAFTPKNNMQRRIREVGLIPVNERKLNERIEPDPVQAAYPYFIEQTKDIEAPAPPPSYGQREKAHFPGRAGSQYSSKYNQPVSSKEMIKVATQEGILRQTMSNIRTGLGRGATVKRLQELMESPKHKIAKMQPGEEKSKIQAQKFLMESGGEQSVEKRESAKCYERSASFNPGRSKEEIRGGGAPIISNQYMREASNTRRKKSIDVNSDIGRLILAAESQLQIDLKGKEVPRPAKLASRLDKIVSNRKFKN